MIQLKEIELYPKTKIVDVKDIEELILFVIICKILKFIEKYRDKTTIAIETNFLYNVFKKVFEKKKINDIILRYVKVNGLYVKVYAIDFPEISTQFNSVINKFLYRVTDRVRVFYILEKIPIVIDDYISKCDEILKKYEINF